MQTWEIIRREKKLMDELNGTAICREHLQVFRNKDWINKQKVKKAIEEVVVEYQENDNLNWQDKNKIEWTPMHWFSRLKKIFIEGVVTWNGRMQCNKCKKDLNMGDKIFTDGTNINYDLCSDCYSEYISQ